jgi:hypothetical protein
LKKYGNYIEGVSKNKLYKQGYQVYISYWTDKVSQQNIITKLDLEDYVYTQKKDKNGLWHIIIYAK